jgi:hypothetical protein
VSLELGTLTVWLGMPVEEVRQEAKAGGFVVAGTIVEDGSSILVKDGRAYTLYFVHGKLVMASRSWVSSDADTLTTVLGALASLDARRDSPCSISHDPLSTPEMKADRVWVKCGQTSVLLAKGTLNGKDFYDVSESIGSY